VSKQQRNTKRNYHEFVASADYKRKQRDKQRAMNRKHARSYA
jgi:hypothetical protein